ncbi:hypothetical protein NX059_005072 [Plenodomus lindquistii]|nr:hypothetical protein NX059_005072 [Plenodomus lindquistii]
MWLCILELLNYQERHISSLSRGHFVDCIHHSLYGTVLVLDMHQLAQKVVRLLNKSYADMLRAIRVLSDNVRTDLALRNVTVYAQWASVLAATLLYVLAMINLGRLALVVFVLPAGSMRNQSGGWLMKILYVGPVNFLLPLVAIAIELPQYFRRGLLFFLSTASWFVTPVRNTITFFRHTDRMILGTYKKVIFSLTSLSLPLLLGLISVLWAENVPGLKERQAVTFMYLALLGCSAYSLDDNIPLWAWWNQRDLFPLYHQTLVLIYLLAMVLFGLAAILYSIARFKRHVWVSSITLGGTGIEPMRLLVPGTGPLYQSIGGEAEGGAIRLV